MLLIIGSVILSVSYNHARVVSTLKYLTKIL